MYVCMYVCVYVLPILPHLPVGLQFSLYGEPLVKACIASRCDYIDVTGEPYVSGQVAMKTAIEGSIKLEDCKIQNSLLITYVIAT